MSNHRKVTIAVLSAAFLVAGLVGPAGAHFKKANGKRVSKKHARMHRAEAAQAAKPSSVDLAPSGLVASSGDLRMYSTTVDGQILQELVIEGYDVTPVEDAVEGTEIVLVLSAGERKALQAKGVSLTFESSGREHKAGRQAVTASDSIYGWDVFRSYDEPGGIEDQIRAIANRPQNRGFLRLYDIGDSIEGRDILAVRMTQGARGLPLGKRPAVLYQATTHAREWISTEVNMRLLKWYVAERRAGNPEIKELLQTTELWFLPVVNPDGYEFTFTDERLWRKNLRDNNGDGQITNGDGVDLNRNYAEHWNYDEEGSSSQFSSETYRGTAPGSEPESAADMHLVENMADFRFAISYHSFGQLLLYTQGWQTLTPSADDPIYVALTGTDDDPAVEGFNPGVGADLYTTNGEFTDWAHGEANVLAWTPELSEGCPGCGFEFPDDETLIQEEFERLLLFSVNVGMSALDPDDPQSHMGLDTAGLYVNEAEIDPWKTNWPTSDLRVQTSYAGGSSQPVEVLAKRAVGDVTLHYSINGGPEQTGPTAESPDGEVYGGNNAYSTYYHYLRGEIPGLEVGDSVEYWFTGGGESTDPVTFDVVEDADADVLIVAAEDYTGVTNIPGYASSTSPNYLSYYEDAVTASGRTSDVYDVDANDRTAPDHLGVLSHYDTVVWYEGNDLVTRSPDRGPGNVSRLAIDNVLNMRQYLNGGGNLLYAGQWAGATVNGVAGGQFYDPVADEPCVVGGALVLARCLLWADKNDFLQYYLGGFAYNSDGGTDPATGSPFPLVATDTPYTGGGPWTFNGADSAQNHVHTASFLTTSSVLPRDEYPQFTSDARANWDRGGGANPFEPFDGDWYVYSQQADVSYKRLMRDFTMPGGGGDMTFRISYDTEFHWDFVFVEIHNVTDDTWSTAPDLNGHTEGGTPGSTGDSCPEGWHELHPWLEQYQGTDCDGAGWHASSGRSAGWEEWVIDLDAFADPGDELEISISYTSDWAVQGLGAFVDQIALPGQPVESFEAGLGSWSTPGSPAGSAPNPNDWVRSEDVGFEEGAIVSQTPTTADFATLYFGFGLEGVDGADARGDLIGRSLTFLGA